MKYWKPVALAAAMVLAAPAAQAATITFTEVGVANFDVVTNQYAAFGITGQNLRHYTDNRDTFDANGVTPNVVPANVIFTSAASNISFDYVLLAGSSLNVGLYDAADMLLETIALSAPTDNVNASHSFMSGGAKFFRMSDSVGTFGLSTLRFDSGNAVPEPATWALLILGFGAVGGAMRRAGARRTTTILRLA